MAGNILGALRVAGLPRRRARSIEPPATERQGAAAEARQTASSERAPQKAPGPNWLLVFLAFFVIAVVQTWPLALHMSDHAIAWPGDSYVMWWNFTWVKDSLLDFSDPFHTEALYHPQGSSLYLHTLAPVNGIISIPLQLVTGNVLLTWNMMSLVFFALSGTGGYALAYHVTRDRWAPIVSGFIFAFSPVAMMHLHGHFHIATTWPIPFFALFLIRFLDSRSWRDLAIVTFMAVILTWNWLEFAIDIGLFAMLLFAFWAATQVRREHPREVPRMVARLLPAIVVWAVLSAPLLIPTARAAESGDYVVRSPDEAAYFSPDLLAYAIPSPLWGPGEFSRNYDEYYSTRAGSMETTVFLGFSPVALAIVAFASRRNSPLRGNIVFWSGAFAFFAVMALGPRLFIFGEDLGVPLPFRLLQEVPLAGERRVPGRMIIVGMLALGVLASVGVTDLARRYGARVRHAGVLLALLALGLVFIEYLSPPVNLAAYHVPPIYEQIGRESGDFAVLDLPLGRVTGNSHAGDVVGGAMSDYAQVIHGKASVGGYLSRARDTDLDWLQEQPGLGYLACPECDGFPRASDLDRERVRALFTEIEIKYVVVNLVTFEGKPTTLVEERTAAEVQTYIEDTLGLEAAGSGVGWLAYRNPNVP